MLIPFLFLAHNSFITYFLFYCCLNSANDNNKPKFHVKNNLPKQNKVTRQDFRWDTIPSSSISRDIVDVEGYTWDLIILLPNPEYHSYDRNKYKNQLTCELLGIIE